MNDIPLTVEQREFASKWHNLIYTFLKQKGRSIDDYYDIVSFGYLRAVRRYLTEPELQQYSFSTIAWRAMESDLLRYYKSQSRKKRHAYVVSLNSYDGPVIWDEILFSSDKDMVQFETKLLLHDLEAIATRPQMAVVHMRSEGYSEREIAKKNNLPLARVRELMEETRMLLEEVCYG